MTCAQQGSHVCVSTMLDRQVLTLYLVYSYAKHENFKLLCCECVWWEAQQWQTATLNHTLSHFTSTIHISNWRRLVRLYVFDDIHDIWQMTTSCYGDREVLLSDIALFWRLSVGFAEHVRAKRRDDNIKQRFSLIKWHFDVHYAIYMDACAA